MRAYLLTVILLLACVPGCSHGINPWHRTMQELRVMQSTAIDRCEKSTDPIARAQYQICERATLAAQRRAIVVIRAQADFDRAKRDGLILTELKMILEGALKAAIYARDAAYHHCEAVQIDRPVIKGQDLGTPDAGKDGGEPAPDAGAHDAGHGG